MRSPCAFSAGASIRSTLTTTVCGPSFSKSWMPIDTLRRKSRRKTRRAMSLVLLLEEGDIARPPGQMFTRVDDQGVAADAGRRHDVAQCPDEIVGGDADRQRIGDMLLLEFRRRLVQALQGEAWRDAHYAYPGRER